MFDVAAMKALLTNCTYLEDQAVNVMGFNIYGIVILKVVLEDFSREKVVVANDAQSGLLSLDNTMTACMTLATCRLALATRILRLGIQSRAVPLTQSTTDVRLIVYE